MFGLLRVIDGPDRGKMFTLVEGQTLVVGRGPDAEASLRDPKVAPAHCQVQLSGGRAVVRDAGSVAGTRLNGERVTEHELTPGDAIRIGNTTLSFQWTTIDENATQQDLRLRPDE